MLQSEAQFGQATQDLIVRVAQAYFDVLAAQDNLEFTIANKIAIAEQLAQAKRNFEVGTATITDTNEAQARYDLAGAQEISGQNALEVAIRALQQIIGDIPDKLVPLKAVAMTTPTPNVMDEWAKAARVNNLVVRGNEAVFEIATKEIERQRAGHYPTLDVVTSYTDSTTVNPNVLGPRNTINQGAVGLQLALPIFAGGSVSSRTREAVALREKARQDVEASKRAAEFNARQSYLNVTNGLAQVKALEQALVSSETALQSNRVGYEVGVRINIDVLNAQQQVFQTKRDLARARYDTILNGLRLKSAAGSLTESDVEIVNALLGFDATAPRGGPMIDTPQKPPSGMLDATAAGSGCAGRQDRRGGCGEERRAGSRPVPSARPRRDRRKRRQRPGNLRRQRRPRRPRRPRATRARADATGKRACGGGHHAGRPACRHKRSRTSDCSCRRTGDHTRDCTRSRQPGTGRESARNARGSREIGRGAETRTGRSRSTGRRDAPDGSGRRPRGHAARPHPREAASRGRGPRTSPGPEGHDDQGIREDGGEIGRTEGEESGARCRRGDPGPGR